MFAALICEQMAPPTLRPALVLLLAAHSNALSTLPLLHRPPAVVVRAPEAVARHAAAVPARVARAAPRTNTITASAAAFIVSTPLARDAVCALVLALLAKIWVALWGSLAKSGMLPSTLTRKLIHAGTGPLFVMGWPFFSDAPTAVLAACAVPVINLSRLWLAGRAGVVNADSDQLVSSLSRTGDASEVARGPFYYTAVLLAATAFSFRALPGVVAVCQMAVGDGFADIVGRRLGRTKWGIVDNKTVEGSLAFVLSAWAASLGMLAGCHYLGYTTLTASAAAAPMAIISVACAAIELFSTPLRRLVGEFGDDNLTVPLAGALLSLLLLRG